MFKPEVLRPRINRNVKVIALALLILASGPISFFITAYVHQHG